MNLRRQDSSETLWLKTLEHRRPTGQSTLEAPGPALDRPPRPPAGDSKTQQEHSGQHALQDTETLDWNSSPHRPGQGSWDSCLRRAREDGASPELAC